MNRRNALGAFTGALTGSAFLRAQARDVEGATLDRVYQALEKMTSRSAESDLAGAIKDLRFALDQNGSFGDAHYYLSLCYRQMKQTRQADQALERAKLYGSRALSDARDPFRVATPPRIETIQNPSRVGNKWALTIGINKFRHAVRPLTFAAADAKEVAQVLADGGVGRFPKSQVETLLDEEATTANIKGSLNKVGRLAKPDDIVFLFLSSHGTSRDLDHKQANYVVTHDTDLASPDSLYGTALPMVEISEIIRTRCSALRTVIVLDTCHSGGALNVRGPQLQPCVVSPKEVDRFREGSGRFIVTASQVEEKSYERGGNGYFTRAFLDALVRTKGCSPLSTIFGEVQREVSLRVLRELGRKQTPTLGRSDQTADILLGAPACQA